MKGQIVKGIAGFYFVKSGETIYRCKARGIFKKQGMKPAVGDMVIFEGPEDEDDGLITEILPRENSFIRPPLSNVDRIIVVTAITRPNPVLQIMDKLLVTAEQAEADPIVCINKCDLVSEASGASEDVRTNLDMLKEIYEGIYPVVCTSKDDVESLSQLREHIRGGSAALAGPSGTGKSTILNRLLEGEHMETGRISEKSRRGRHTTRHVELFHLDDEGTGLFDTPGFTSFDLPPTDPAQLGDYFPEIEGLASECRYDDCRHMAEPDCAVKKAVDEGRIHRSRYDSYCAFMEEALSQRQY